jgi:AcrR family transcriptional regulator
MPRSAALNERLREESRAKILEHAVDLFGRNGVDRTSMSMIAKAAGVSPGLIYHYFEGKPDLLRAIVALGMRDVAATFVHADEGDRTPADRIARLVRAALGGVRDNLQFWRLMYGLRMQGAVLDALGDDVPGSTDAIRSRIEEYFRNAGAARPDLEAALLFALVDGVAQHYALEPATYPLDAVIERMVERYRELGARELARSPSEGPA